MVVVLVSGSDWVAVLTLATLLLMGAMVAVLVWVMNDDDD